MSERRVEREGRVVELGGRRVVRFAGGCGAGCRCVPLRQQHEIPLATLGAGDVAVPGQRVSVSVSADALTRLAVVLFALPLAALVVGAWIGASLAAPAGITADAAAALTGLAAMGLTLSRVTRSPGALVRTLLANVRLLRTDK